MNLIRILIYLFEGVSITVCFYLITKSQLSDYALMMLSSVVGFIFMLLIILYDQSQGCDQGQVSSRNKSTTP